MKLIPNYSYEFNIILNEQFEEQDQIKNFASLLSDKDRFLALLPLLEQNAKLIEEKSGFKLPKEIEFFVVRAEKFKSFSLPITIEYSLLPQEMLLFLLKEILKQIIDIRFPDEEVRETYINSFIDYFTVNGDFGKEDLVKYSKNLHEESKRLYPKYKFDDIDYSNKNLKEYIEELYSNI